MKTIQRGFWLPFLRELPPEDLTAPAGVAAFELQAGLAALAPSLTGEVRADPALPRAGIARTAPARGSAAKTRGSTV